MMPDASEASAGPRAVLDFPDRTESLPRDRRPDRYLNSRRSSGGIRHSNTPAEGGGHGRDAVAPLSFAWYLILI